MLEAQLIIVVTDVTTMVDSVKAVCGGSSV